MTGKLMTSCSISNLTIYYLNQNYLLDRNFISMRVLCWLLLSSIMGRNQ